MMAWPALDHIDRHGYVAPSRTREHGLINVQRLGSSGSEMSSSSPPSALDGGRPTCEWVQGSTLGLAGWAGGLVRSEM